MTFTLTMYAALTIALHIGQGPFVLLPFIPEYKHEIITEVVYDLV
jgi:hypothetical protein